MTSTAVPVPDFKLISCADILQFQEALGRSRKMDDKIIYELNVAVPTSSFAKGVDVTGRCHSVYTRLSHAYDEREAALRRCIHEAQSRLAQLKDADSPHYQITNANTMVRLYRNEINVEEVVKDRSLKVFHERCRSAYSPPTENKPLSGT